MNENGVRRKWRLKYIQCRAALAKANKGETKTLAMVLKRVDRWKIEGGRSTVTRIERVIVEPDGTYYDLDQGRKASIHQHKPGSQDLGLYQDGGVLDE